MDFFKTDDKWTCEDAIKYYMLDLKQILSKINKDLKEISKFDHVVTRREKAEVIICNWKAQQQNEIIKTSVVRDQVVRTALSKQLENSKIKIMKPPLLFYQKKRAHNTMQETEKNITEEDLINSVNDASNTFGKIEFPSFYSKLKTTWDNQNIANYYVIDLGNKDTMRQVHDLLDEDELKLLFRRLLLDEEEVHIDEKKRKYLEPFDQIIDEENKENIHYNTVVDEVAEIGLLDKTNEETKYTGDDENFNKSIAKMKEIMDQLDITYLTLFL
ncbi:18339_t:CDS:2 [Gigaspora margarita]|uniref:18339_t:CDS:1 n=1 Tax=Gigaspora margarita TaxID=4874 RepID=A0ABN7V4F8_GIGMA|nr:18339_t:CDS:2 [Gigaspora margarita]